MRSVSTTSRAALLIATVLAGALIADASVTARGASGGGAASQRVPMSRSDIHKRWAQVGTAAEDAAVGPIHVYLALPRAGTAAHAAAAACADSAARGATPESIAACKKAALAPAPADLAALRGWLAPLAGGAPLASHEEFLRPEAKGCAIDFSAIHCRGATVAEARAVFGAKLKFATYVQRRSDVARPREAVLTAGALDIPARVARLVAHVSGVQVYDHARLSAKHMGVATPGKKAAREESAAGNSLGDEPWPSFYPSAWNAVGATLSGPAPRIIHTDFSYAMVIPMCSDGTPVQMGLFATAPTCPNAGSSMPNVTVYVFPSGNAGNVLLTAPLNWTQCKSGDNFSPSATFAVCRVAIGAAYNTSLLFADYGFKAMSVFTAVGPVAPAVGGPVSFFDGTNYAVGSSDIDGAVLTQMPAPTTQTYPNAILPPAAYFDKYNVPASAQSAPSQVQGVVEFSDPQQPAGGFYESDLVAYLQQFAHQTAAAAANMSVVGNSSIVSRGETTLDIELVMGVAPLAQSYIFCLSYGPGAEYASYPDALVAFATRSMGSVGAFGMATVWSMSYGGPEWTTEPALMQHLDSLFEQLSDSGVMVSASSGDTGVYFYYGAHSAAPEVIYSPNWPATSPHVVAVGATAASNPTGGSNAGVVEIACNVRNGNIITSGGGFSQVFPAPAYQKAALPSGSTMLGAPDVAMVGAWIATVLEGQATPLFGTSASSPIFAALITLVNAQRAKAGLASIRNVPAFLYAAHTATAGAAFIDIVSGDNCAGEPVQPGLSGNYPTFSTTNCYSTLAGWDAVTGLGSLDWAVLNAQAASWNPAAPATTTAAPARRA